ncbi:hypothetical protein G4G27_05910 [Sphingomonas sp. So64.6b]|uniref:hypothetical protein n=1 Tax=Sphingomonas sp. So64.6b TaxID=2997354 RepID=UPI001601EE99|nr:hypothetical protein [Sphingomonas sp. So64.6b]QNA83585.1 hypothetical protein G4G27_05910 [Sphingomonas sp. So64.6b]
MSFGWDEAVAFALTLPGVTIGAGAKGTTSPQIRGQQIVSQGRDSGTFVLRATREEIEILKETDPACFWQTPQYEGWPTVLVRTETADPDRLKVLIERAWWDRATKAQRAARGGDRP